MNQFDSTMRFWHGLVIGTVVLTCAVAARAQECVRIDTDPPRGTITLESDLITSTVAPGTYCSLEPGNSYRVITTLRNYESRVLKFRFLGLEEPPKFSGDRLRYLSRSLVMPGWGQATRGYTASAAESFVATVGAALRFPNAYAHYRRERDLFDLTEAALEAAVTPEQTDALRDELALRRDNVEAYEEHLLLTGGLAGYMYLSSLVETWLVSAPPGRKTLTDGTVQLSMPHVSGARAAVRSFFFPGLGQKYSGHHARAVLVQMGFMVSAMFAIDRRLEYKLRDADYRQTYDRFQNGETLAQRERARFEATVKWNEREGKKTSMYQWGIAAGSFWLLGVVDAAISGGGDSTPAVFDVETSMGRRSVRSGLVFRF